MNRKQWLKRLKQLHQTQYNICVKKNQDYSSEADPFANFRLFGELGFLVRMSDKLSRLKQYVERGELSVEDESVVDTLHDLANYANLLIGYLESKKVIIGDMKHVPKKECTHNPLLIRKKECTHNPLWIRWNG